MDKVGTGAGRLDIAMQIGSAWQMTVRFRTYDGTTYTPEDISTKTFSFTMWKFKGSRKKIVNLTNGNGITVPVYSTDEILISVPAASITGIDEGQYYYELRRTDLNKAKLFGLDYLSYEAEKI